MFDSWITGVYSEEDLAADCWLLKHSDIFKAATYRATAGISRWVDAAEHYLREGWRRGLEPGPEFEGQFLYPYYQSAGFQGPPAITYLTLRADGHAAYATRLEVEAIAETIRATNLFDAGDYIDRVGIDQLDPLLHYIIVGEAMGHVPSAAFDPVEYGERYVDVKNAGVNRLFHYARYGRSERRLAGRRRKSPSDFSRIDPSRKTVLLILHEASRTGAPLLGYNLVQRLRQRYNVVALLLADGELVQDFRDCCTVVIGPFDRPNWTPTEATYVVERILASCDIFYAIANSIESRKLLEPLALAHVPVVALVHEFSSTVTPPGQMGRALEWATQIIFSAEIVRASARTDYPNLSNRTIHILSQGRVDLPPREEKAQEKQLIQAIMRPPGHENAVVVLGCGTIIPRKGVDIFLSCARAVARLVPTRSIRFIWIGMAPDPSYLKSLSKQFGLQDRDSNAAIVGEVGDLGPAYNLADMFFLSSRLDPFPNVCIDAALHGLPIICFEESTGFAEFLRATSLTQTGLVPHLDVDAAANLIVRMANDDLIRKELGEVTQHIADKTFNMDRYVDQLDKIGCDAVSIMRQRTEDFKTIATDGMFDLEHFTGSTSNITNDDAIRLYLARSSALGNTVQHTVNFYYRRPSPGFHPQAYTHDHRDLFDPGVINPLAHFIRSGKPEGPWQLEVIRPGLSSADSPGDGLTVALHGHFFYPELAADFLQKLAANQSRCDLLLSTSNRYKAWSLRRATASYTRGTVTIRVVPNRGRDIGAFLSAFAEDILRYDIVGHIHSKRSLILGAPQVGEVWREFLWQNLIGDRHPMMDIVIKRMAEDATLGLVFPSDPHLSHWDLNLPIAEQLARHIGIEEVLPPFFDFPNGTMFWARSAALAPLLDAKLDWKDYPEEPLVYDGTLLHAIERLLPFVARQAGYRCAVTHVPGVNR